MTSLYKFAPLSLAMILLAVTSFNSGLLNAQENSKKTMDNAVVKQKIIGVKRNADAMPKIEIEDAGDVKVIELTAVELDDPAMLESKLADLDEDTRVMLMEALNSNNNSIGKGLAFISSESISDGSIEMLKVKRDDAVNIETNIDSGREVIVLNRGDATFKGVLKGHHKAVINLIEKGDFKRDELNEIRKALDAKF